MEDIIGWLLIACVFAIPVGIAWRIHKRSKKYDEEIAAIARKRKEEADAWMKEMRTKSSNKSTPKQVQHVPKNSIGIQANRDVNVKVSNASDDLGDLTTMIVLNQALSSLSGMATATIDHDKGEIKVSDYFSDSSSYSDGGPSSSDSGPSSDW